MPRIRVALVYGTRPEAIKMAPVVRALRRRPETFEVAVCATAQHRELLDQAQRLFGLVPDHDLDLMTPGQGLNQVAARVLEALDRLLAALAPDWLLVQGDTTSAAAAALAAFHLGLRVGHVEAGLRTGDLARPFPEEANRRIVDLLSDALFAPTALAARRLREAGTDPARIFLTGNTGIDALYQVAASLTADGREAASSTATEAGEVLVTVHRRESFGEPLQAILGAVGVLARRFPALRWIYPVHPNPRVAGPAAALLSGIPNLTLRPPLAYDELVRQLLRSRLVLTDSGGLQEEAPAFGKPVLVLRDATERPEGIDAGVALLVGTDPHRIVAETERLLTDSDAYRRMATVASPYGDGQAAERIAAILAGEPYEPFQAKTSRAAVAGVPAAARTS
ncbi:MAG: UDP-N-acetylglucosamine 2-epimerase (non-hydrolyzing) [Acidobacteria bacterium]|nr:UDP-N-acetylglucosamine 2-epimerase (non-hydrolyzing) [Acidobacteriota bacterium]